MSTEQKEISAGSPSKHSGIPHIIRALLILRIGTLITVGLIWLINGEFFVDLEERLLILFRHSSDLANPLGPIAIEEAIQELTCWMVEKVLIDKQILKPLAPVFICPYFFG